MSMSRSVCDWSATWLSRPAIVLAVVAVLAASTSLYPRSALAATTWTVSPGGHITATSGAVVLTDTRTGASVSCSASSLTGSLNSGSGLPGTGIGSISAFSLSSCTGPGGQAFTATSSSLPWQLNALTYNGSQAHARSVGVTTGEIVGGRISLASLACHILWWGQPSILMFQYSNSTARLTTLASSGMTLYNVSGCSGSFASGDVMTLSANLAVSPPQVINSP
jgi:hypothetical protein